MRDIAVVVVLAAIVWLGLAFPLVMPFPETVDWPGHQVRHALALSLHEDSVLAGLYAVEWRPIPNLAGDLAMMLLGPIFGVSIAGRLLLALGMAGWVAAPLLLQRALFGQTTLWPLVASLFVYNAILYMGFENFYLTAPLAMAAFAGWVATDEEAWNGRRLGLLAVAAQLVWFGHLVVWGVLGLWIGSYELGRPGADLRTRLTRTLAAGAMFLPGAVLFVWQQIASPATHGGGTVWAGAGFQKLGLVLSPVLQYQPNLDLTMLLVVLPLVATFTLLDGSPRIHRRMQWVVAIMGVVTLLMPGRLMGVGFMDQRLPAMWLGLLVASTEVTFTKRTVAVGVGALVGLALVTRIGTTFQRWSRHSAETAELLTLRDYLEPGQRVLPAGTDRIAHYHTASWLVPEARVFLPSLFTGAHLLQVDPAVAPLDHPTPAPPSRETLLEARNQRGRFAPGGDPADLVYLTHWWTDFDHLLWLDPGPPPWPLETVAKGSWFTLYRLPPETP
ncbi:MAG: hypothetical protein AAGA48_12850 [Myxococcota bacterium]